MGSRVELHRELLELCPHVYFQPPSDVRMSYPCIVYNKVSKQVEHANDHIYKSAQEYQITVMDQNPDTVLPDLVLAKFRYSSPGSFFVVENVNQTTIKLYF